MVHARRFLVCRQFVTDSSASPISNDDGKSGKPLLCGSGDTGGINISPLRWYGGRKLITPNEKCKRRRIWSVKLSQVVADFSRLYDGLYTGGFGVTKTRKITNALENSSRDATAEDTLPTAEYQNVKDKYNIIIFIYKCITDRLAAVNQTSRILYF